MPSLGPVRTSDNKSEDAVDSYLRWHWVAASSTLLLLDVLLIDHRLLLFGCEAVLWRKAIVAWHRRRLARDLGMADIIGGPAGVLPIHAILIFARSFGRIETCLSMIEISDQNRWKAVRGLPGSGSCPQLW